MDNIIEVEFKKQERSTSALEFKNSKVFADARIYAYYLYDLLEEINDHFWNNYQTAETEITTQQAYEFDHFVKQVKRHIGFSLDDLNQTGDNNRVYEYLQYEYKVNFVNVINWLKDVKLPYRQAKVINIHNFIGARI